MEELKALENIIHCLKMGSGLAACKDCNLYPCKPTDVNDLARVAIKAIEKQIPKKVVCDGDDESDYVYCPYCNECIGVNEFVWNDFWHREWKPMYCQECGQAMIWE